MRSFRTKTTLEKRTLVLITTCITLTFASLERSFVANTLAQNRFATDVARAPQSNVTPVDMEPFTLRSPGKEFDEPGVMKYGGYSVGGSNMIRYRYRGENADATVEVVEHPPKYLYARHDFLGTFFHVYEDHSKELEKGTRTSVSPVQHVEWRMKEQGVSHTLCLLLASTETTYIGLVGWYAQLDEGITTVMIRFSSQKGLPHAVIDEYLDKFPSSMRGTVPSLESWQADDIAKWIALLQTRSSEDVILDVGCKHLHRYDAGAFGLLDAWNKRNEPAALTDAVDKSIERLKAWLDNREKTKGRDGRP